MYSLETAATYENNHRHIDIGRRIADLHQEDQPTKTYKIRRPVQKED